MASFSQRLRAGLIDLGLIVVLPLFLLPFLKTAGLAVGVVLGFGAIVYFEGGATGQSIGKSLMGLRVVSKTTGEAIGYAGEFKRTLGKIVSTLALGAGDLWMLRSPDRQCWHDRLVGTIVVTVQVRRRVRRSRTRA